MTYSIVYSSRTGNTKMLAEALRMVLPEAECVYFGEPDEAALQAECLYIGFWTDRGTCDKETEQFLATVKNRKVFLFGTAGFGGFDAYFQQILDRVMAKLDPGVSVIGTYMCQGRMPLTVRQRYQKMMEAPDHAPNLEAMIENFDEALSHPDANDLMRLKQSVVRG